MSRLLVIALTVMPAVSSMFGLASTSVAEASVVYDITLTENFYDFLAGANLGNSTAGSTVSFGTAPTSSGIINSVNGANDRLTINFGSTVFSDTNLTGDSIVVSGGAVKGINTGDIDSGRGIFTIALNLNDILTDTFTISNAFGFTIESGTFTLTPVVTPVPAALPLLAGGAGVLACAVMFGRRNKLQMGFAAV